MKKVVKALSCYEMLNNYMSFLLEDEAANSSRDGYIQLIVPVRILCFMLEHKTITRLHGIIKELRGSAAAWPFLHPVDWKGLGLEDYPLIVTEPMDLKTVGKKLKGKQYKTVAQFWQDVNLIWSNCKLFNSESAEVFGLAAEMEDLTKGLKASFEDIDIQQQRLSQTNQNVSTVEDIQEAVLKEDSVTLSQVSSVLPPSVLLFVDRLIRLEPTILLHVIKYIADEAPGCLLWRNNDLQQQPSALSASPTLQSIDLDVGQFYSEYPEFFTQTLGSAK